MANSVSRAQCSLWGKSVRITSETDSTEPYGRGRKMVCKGEEGYLCDRWCVPTASAAVLLVWGCGVRMGRLDGVGTDSQTESIAVTTQ